MRKRLGLISFLLIIFLIFLFAGRGLAEGLSFTLAPSEMRPGKTERISFFAPTAGMAELSLIDESGAEVLRIREGLLAEAGENHLSWDGTLADGQPMPQGSYQFRLRMGEEEALAPVQIGPESPQILSVSAPSQVTPGDVWAVTVNLNMPGTLSLRVRLEDGEWHTFLEEAVPAGESVHYWNGQVDNMGIAYGEYAIQLRLIDETNYSGTARQIFLSVLAPAEAAPETPAPILTESPRPEETTAAESAPPAADASTEVPTPAPTHHVVIPSGVTTQAQETNYWTLPMGEMDEEAIWNVMMQPIVVLDGEQKEVYRLRKTPDKSAKRDNVVGEVTYASQGLHILETLDNGWTKVEVYNSSYGPDCTSRPGYGVTDDRLVGYVETSRLKTITPRTDYALLIDKLEQTMYIFSDGKCIGSLLISTGLNNSKQSWNETPSGEFLMVSRMGGFPAGNLWCSYGMRVNGGCAIHEVPYIGNADTPASQRDYSSTVKLLGQKASHGCIRVQKAANEQGQNIKWLWDNIRVNTKVLIWDDTGRFLSYPDDGLSLYYNPNGGKYYHESQNCATVKSRYLPLTEFKYSELDTAAFSKLSPCSGCARVMRKSDIDALNAENGF